MKKIELRCRTLGFQYGDIVNVGNGKDEVSLKDAKVLVETSLAVEVNPKVMVNDKELQAEIKALKVENEKLLAVIEDLQNTPKKDKKGK